MGNANYQHSMNRRHALMMQLNPKLKQMFSYKDFQDAAPFLFGENFGTMAKECLEAAEALRKSIPMANSKKGFQKGHFQKVAGGGSQYSSAGRSQGWQGPGKKAKKGEMTRQQTDCNSMFSKKFIKNCFIYLCVKHTGILLTGVNQHNKPVNNMPKIGWASCILPTKLGGANPRPMGTTNCGWLPPRVDRGSNIGKSASPNKVFTRGQW